MRDQLPRLGPNGERSAQLDAGQTHEHVTGPRSDSAKDSHGVPGPFPNAGHQEVEKKHGHWNRNRRNCCPHQAEFTTVSP